MTKPSAHGLAIEITGQCNQKCGYCFNAWREDGGAAVSQLDTPTLLALVDRALREVEFDHVAFSGGEPLARADIFDVMEVCKRHGKRIHVVSNGTLISDAVIEKLSAFRPMSVQITLNGPTALTHDHFAGAGHFDRAVAGIRRLVRGGFSVTGTIVLTRVNAHLTGPTLAKFLELGVRDVGLSRFSPAGYSAKNIGELLPARRDVLTALQQAEPFARDSGMLVCMLLPIPPCVVQPSDFPSISFGGCPVGTPRQEFALGPRGELRHCLLHPNPIGDALHESFAELVTAPAVTHYRDVTPAFCAPCPERTRCIGGCGAAAASVMGDPRALDPFVAQHVDPAFAERLRALRASEGGTMSPASLVRSRKNSADVGT